MKNLFYVLAALALTTPAFGQGSPLSPGGPGGHQLLVHLPFDGSAQTAAGDQSILVGLTPQTVPGQIGQAMKFDGTSIIAVPLDLSASEYPQVTITAWVRADSSAPNTDHTIVSSSSQTTTPLLRLWKRDSGSWGFETRANLRAASASHSAGTWSPTDRWVFTAGAVDIPAQTLRLLQGDMANWGDGLRTDMLYPASEHENPNDPDVEKRAYVFIGARTFNAALAPETGVAINDGGAEQSVSAGVDLPGQSEGDVNRPDYRSPTQGIERWRRQGTTSTQTIPKFRSPTQEIDSARREGRNESRSAEQQAEANKEPETDTGTGWRLSSTDIRRTSVTGARGEIVIPIDLVNTGFSILSIFGNSNIPCYVSIAGDRAINGTHERTERVLERSDRCVGGGSVTFEGTLHVHILPAFVGGITL